MKCINCDKKVVDWIKIISKEDTKESDYLIFCSWDCIEDLVADDIVIRKSLISLIIIKLKKLFKSKKAITINVS